MSLRSLILVALFAQRADAQPDRGACIPQPIADTTSAFVTGIVLSFDSTKTLPTWYANALWERIRAEFRMPTHIALPAFERTRFVSDSQAGIERGFPALHAMVGGSIGRDADPAFLASSSLVSAFDSALVAAVATAFTDSASAPPPEMRRLGKIPLRVRIDTELAHSGDRNPLFSMRVPIAPFASSVMQQGGRRPPQYPRAAVAQSVEGEVYVRFVVDETGTPLLRSLMIYRATVRDFAQSVVKYLERARFEPAILAGCPVAVYAYQPFNFALIR